MRGGRFQQKTTEDASLRNAEALFESRTVVDIREVEANTRREIDEKKEELRQLVGASYRDLIDSADSIVHMKKLCENVAQNIRNMEEGFQTLKSNVSIPPALPDIDKEKKRREKLYGIGSRVKYIVDTPEKIWGCLDEHMYLEGAQRYFRAREVQSILMQNSGVNEKRDLLTQFPLLRHQWSLVETFRGQISHRSRDRLLEVGLDVHQYAVALAAVAVIDELSPSQIVSLFFETRRASLRLHLRTATIIRDRGTKNRVGESARESTDAAGQQVADNVLSKKDLHHAVEGGEKSSGDGNDTSKLDANAIAMVFYRAANMIQITLCQAGQLFLEVNGDPPLFFSTVLNSPPGSQLFGGIPNPENEAQLWKGHWEKLEARMSTLPGQFISETCISWIHTCQKDITPEGRLLLGLVEHGKDLGMIESIIKGECDSKKSLKESIDWLESAYGKSIDVPWDYVTALVLKEPLDLWNTLFENMFVGRAKDIIDFGLSKVDVEKSLNEFLASISFEDGLNQAPTSLVSFEKEKQVDKFSYDEGFEISRSYLGPEILQLKDEINMNLQAILEDSVNFFQTDHNTASRTGELVPYLQNQCFSWMSNVINKLQMRVLNLEDGLGQRGKTLNFLRTYLDNHDKGSGNSKALEFVGADSEDVSPVVEKALFLGRLLMAFSQPSWALPAILHPFKAWDFKDGSFAQMSPPWLPSLQSNSVWSGMDFLGSKHTQPMRGVAMSSLQTNGHSSSFTKLQLSLRYSNLLAHSIWVSWSIQKLSMALGKSLSKDDDLASQIPLKGWEDTLLRQRSETGDEIEVRLPLPAMPSPYVISFLFKSCQEIYRIGGHSLDRAVLQLFAWRLLEKVLIVYEDFILGLQESEPHVSEKGLLQLLFDLRFLGDVLSGGQHLSLDFAQFLKDEPSLSSIFSTSNLARIKDLLIQVSGSGEERRKWLDSLQEKLSRLLDPIDWATYEPHLWENEQQFYQRCSVLFGFLDQLNRLYRDSAQRLPLMSTEASILRVSTSVPRFTYLPISTPSMAKKTANDESGSLQSSVAAKERASKLMFEDEASAAGAKPLFRSLMNQVGSRFGEGTFKFGSMLTDGQVSRLKDRSAAAISTFGDILPAQAAGLLSSLTAKSETLY